MLASGEFCIAFLASRRSKKSFTLICSIIRIRHGLGTKITNVVPWSPYTTLQYIIDQFVAGCWTSSYQVEIQQIFRYHFILQNL
ncbi:hypothetical protein K1719_033939 [Acacia pycnantha]|nr:hypothetical protein K1719_033939 [Acacia pycnantha]